MAGGTYAEIVVDEIRAAGYSVGVVGYIDGEGRDMSAADAHRGNSLPRYIARVDSELGAMVALQKLIRELKE